MAKKTPSSGTDIAVSAELSKRVENAISAIKRPFTMFVKDFAALASSREELAPKFMRAFGMWQTETAGTFVGFVRMLAPEIGNTRQEYRSHRAYQAADYLRRVTSGAARRPSNNAEGHIGPATPTDAFARLMSSFLTLIPEPQQATLWQAVSVQLNWTDRQVTRLQTQVEHVAPLVDVKTRAGHIRLAVPDVSEKPSSTAAAAA